MLLKILHSLSVLNIPNFKRYSYKFTLALNFFITKAKDICGHLHVYPSFHTSWQTREDEMILTQAFQGLLASALQNSSTRGHSTKGYRWS